MRSLFTIAVFAASTVLLVLLGAFIATAFWGWIAPSPLGEIPNSVHVVEQEFRRLGMDTVQLFVLSVPDATFRDELIARWRLQDLSESDDAPTSFVETNHSTWWPNKWPAQTRAFGHTDSEAEKYWSVWEDTQRGLLYIEVGTW